MLADPLLHIAGLPHLAHAEHDHGRGEVGARDDLLHALTADAARRAPISAAPIRWCMAANIVIMLLVA